MDESKMVDKKSIQLFLIISTGVFIGNLLSWREVLSFPRNIWYYYNDMYVRSKFNKKYKRYLADNSIDSLTQDNKEGRNILILCHGRSHCVAYIDVIDYERDNILTIDIDPSVNPHLLLDLSDSECLKSIPDSSVDVIIFNSCTRCTKGVNCNQTMGSESYRILKKDGEVWVRDSNKTQIPLMTESGGIT